MDVEPVLRKAGGAVDDRFRAAGWAKGALRKVFPDHWSFFLGELALYSFIILLVTDGVSEHNAPRAGGAESPRPLGMETDVLGGSDLPHKRLLAVLARA